MRTNLGKTRSGVQPACPAVPEDRSIEGGGSWCAPVPGAVASVSDLEELVRGLSLALACSYGVGELIEDCAVLGLEVSRSRLRELVASRGLLPPAWPPVLSRLRAFVLSTGKRPSCHTESFPPLRL